MYPIPACRIALAEPSPVDDEDTSDSGRERTFES